MNQTFSRHRNRFRFRILDRTNEIIVTFKSLFQAIGRYKKYSLHFPCFIKGELCSRVMLWNSIWRNLPLSSSYHEHAKTVSNEHYLFILTISRARCVYANDDLARLLLTIAHQNSKYCHVTSNTSFNTRERCVNWPF